MKTQPSIQCSVPAGKNKMAPNASIVRAILTYSIEENSSDM